MNITILGAGAYGLALSSVLIKNKHKLKIWTPFEGEKNELLETKKSSKLQSYNLDSSIEVTTDLEYSVKNSKLIIIAVPTAFISDSCKKLNKHIKRTQHICIASKGIEKNTGLFIHQIVRKYIKTSNIGVISGPSFAIDLVKKVPVGLSIASKNKKTRGLISKAFSNDDFRLYPISDIIGVEVCGAIKNIIAIASGMIDGMNYPISTKAFFLTKIINDTSKLVTLLGGQSNTLLSLAGFGDIYMTCSSDKSRNYTFGKLIGSKAPKQVIDDYKNNTTIEGIYTLETVYILLKTKKINILSFNIIYNIIYNNADVNELLKITK